MKHEHYFVKISKTKEKCSLCDQYRKLHKHIPKSYDDHTCKICNITLTGTPRPYPYCKICKKSYLDPCFMHYAIPNSMELRYE